ncbi:class I SAM-dependent methyltransferase [Marinicella sp. W31]|uniref:class I SAM-dependent methyltransferase n=1 Tax=Marinicella sp. W31 TaxID=3023713 RepID=UPI00375738B3
MNKSKTLNLQQSNSSWLERQLKKQLLKKLAEIKHAHIEIIDAEGRFSLGDSDSSLRVTLQVHNNGFYRQIAFSGSVGAAESYMADEWDVDDLTALVRILVVNRDLLDDMEGGSAWLKNALLNVWHVFNRNTTDGSRKNIAKHYDLGNELFEHFLDDRLMYSSAIYEHPDEDLNVASERKLRTICEKLELKATDKVVEIGTGWGGFAMYAAENYGCHVTTTTISKEQYDYASARVKEKGLQDNITLLLKDYRDLSGTYDKLVSIEMIEAVGHQFLSTYLNKCNDLLTEEGLGLIQAITIEDFRYEKALKSVDFIKRHIFPGSFIPSVSAIMKSIEKATTLKLVNLEDFGTSYAYTLRDWRKRFHDNIQTIESLGYDRRFQRMWDFYLCYCEGGFLERSISDVHLLLAKPGNRREQLLAIQ